MQRRAFTLGAAALAVAGTLSLSMNVAMANLDFSLGTRKGNIAPSF